MASLEACSSSSAPNNNHKAEKCVPCSDLDESSKLSFDEASAELASLRNPSLWNLKSSNGSSSAADANDVVLFLSRKFTARNFQTAIDSINNVGAIAELVNHHPNLHLTNYREVEIEIYTHKVNGLTKNDFELANKIDESVSIDFSPKWLRENPAFMSVSVKK